MQNIQPHLLTNEEILRYTYANGYDKLGAEWTKSLAERLSKEIDKRDNIYHEGFEDGFDQGIAHAAEDFK
jgi:hypothetical protein